MTEVATAAETAARPRPAVDLAKRVLDAFLRRREASVLVVAIGLVVCCWASTPIFLTTDNLRNIAQATAPTAIVAVGIVFLLVSGEIDVSVGMVAALAPTCCIMRSTSTPSRPSRDPAGAADLRQHRTGERAHHDPVEGPLVRHHPGDVLSAVRRPAHDVEGLPGSHSQAGQG